ncbi:MAG TPA: carboxypeptidase regulatory-like domain-containing protein [Vicinamibacterales bacterium]|nr:carboxypeptidase regulatory-like domain-containing protein [Vicinamibacterales bacterium]
MVSPSESRRPTFPVPAALAWACALTLLAGGRPAEACTCAPSGPPCQAYWQADAVFAGRVDEVAPVSGFDGFRRRRVTFTVAEAFTGVDTPQVVVWTGSGGGDCGFRFKTGATYLVYASRDTDRELSTGICSRTRLLERASADLDYARTAAAGAAPPARVSGTVLVRSDSLSPRQRPSSKPTGGVRVVLERDGLSWPAVSGPDGSFAFEGLEPGKYTVRVEPGAGYYSRVFPETLELRNRHACAEVEVAVFFDGRVSGRVLDAAGRPVPGLTVELTVRTGIDQRFGPRRLRALTGPGGWYEFTQVPPGRFVVGIDTQLDRQGRVAESRVFLPGVRLPGAAVEIVVAGGAHLRAGDFRLPPEIRFVQLTGLVIDAGGVPVEAARVYLKGASGEDYILVEPSLSDSGGRFTIAALEGREYLLFAERARPGARGGLDVSDQMPVVAAASSPPVVLRLERKY